MTFFAPAKVNLFLHVLGRRDDGYHALQSLVCFADVGDDIEITPAPDFTFDITGDFGAQLSCDDNLVIHAAEWIAAHIDQPLSHHIRLHKNLPVAAGIGGGSSDAAAVIRGLLEIWERAEWLDNFAPGTRELGADVPVCLAGRPALMEGTGEILSGIDLPDNIPAVVINPLIPCPTADVFAARTNDFSPAITVPHSFNGYGDLLAFLMDQKNDLQASAQNIVPEIAPILDFLHAHGADLARLSGSGATCFGLFERSENAARAAGAIAALQPGWWVKDCVFNPA